MPFMEGALWKWTNYMSGWQLRWFVLDVGVLSYYKSQDEIKLGSRGSVKMACCDVSTQVNDPLRIDLKIPPDQHIYVRASTPSERQQWLVALGTAKACLTQGNSTAEKAEQQEYKDPKKLLHEKMSEIHICKDILLGQIENIKRICTTAEATQEFQEAATLLSATCDTFLNDIQDCVSIAEQNYDSSSPNSSRANTPVKQENAKNSVRSQFLHPPHNSLTPTQPSQIQTHSSDESPSPNHLSQKSPTSPVLSISNENNAHSDSMIKKTSPSERSILSPSEKPPRRAPTVFTICPHRFIDVRIDEHGNIPTKQFLLACNSILPIFDILGPTAFAPVKLDISGNIKKLTAKYDTNPNAFKTIESMINSEIQTDTCTVKNSATDALLWLKRALQFTNAFLEEVDKGERELVVVASTAYSKTLRKYHGWVVRGVFAMAVKAVPYWKDFARALGTTDAGVASESDVLLDIKDFTNTLGNIITKINDFYAIHKLDSDNTV